jgi:hypothetical protein
MNLLRRRRTIVDMLDEAIRTDPRDAPVVYLEADIMADNLERYTPTADDPMKGTTPARKAWAPGSATGRGSSWRPR